MSRDRRDSNSADEDTTPSTPQRPQRQSSLEEEKERDLLQSTLEEHEGDEARQIEHFLTSHREESHSRTPSQTPTEPEPGSSEELDDGIIPHLEESNEAPNRNE